MPNNIHHTIIKPRNNTHIMYTINLLASFSSAEGAIMGDTDYNNFLHSIASDIISGDSCSK